MALTKAQLRDRTLLRMNVIGQGQAASGDDATLMSSIIDQVFAKYEDDIPFLSSSTPDWAAGEIVDLLAARASPYFGNAPVSMNEFDAWAMFVAARDRRIPKATKPVGNDFF